MAPCGSVSVIEKHLISDWFACHWIDALTNAGFALAPLSLVADRVQLASAPAQWAVRLVISHA